MSIYKEYIRRYPEVEKSVLVDKILDDGEVDTENKESIMRSLRRAEAGMEELMVFEGSSGDKCVFDGDVYDCQLGQDRFDIKPDEMGDLYVWYTRPSAYSVSDCADKLHEKYGIQIPEQLLKRVFKCLDVSKRSKPVPPHGYNALTEEDVSEEYYESVLRMKAMEKINGTENDCYRRLYEDELEKNVKTQEFFDKAAEFLNQDSLPEYSSGVDFRGVSEPAEYAVLLSDWHVGLNIDTRVNKYNQAIFKERIEIMRKKIAKTLTRPDKDYKVTFFILGDMVDGPLSNMRPEQQAQHDVRGAKQCVVAAQGMRRIIEVALSTTDHEVDVYSVGGNHGRVTSSRNDDPLRFGDQVTYEIARSSLNGFDNLNWERSEQRVVETSIGSVRFLGSHGERVPSDISDLVWSHKKQQDSDVIVVTGHLHEFLFEQNTKFKHFRNGCLCGPTEFASQEVGVNSPPQQVAFELLGDKVSRVDFLI